MRFTAHLITSLTTLLVIATATSIKKRTGFTIQQVQKCGLAAPRSPLVTYALAVLKSEPTKSLDLLTFLDFDLGLNRSVTAIPEPFDLEYLSPVNVGGQILNLAIDTGSADLWVFSSQLPVKDRTGHDYYVTHPEKLLNGSFWEVQYGDGSHAKGNVYMDTVSINDVVAPRQAIQAAQEVGFVFSRDTNNDGILGLGFNFINSIRPKAQLGFFDNVKDTLPEPIFTATLKHEEPGTFDFGYIDETKYEGSITYTPVDTRDGYWTISTTGFAIGNYTNHNATIKGLIDTGTSLLLLPPHIVSAYYASIPTARRISPDQDPSITLGGWTIPCNATVPPFSVIIENTYTATIPSEYIKFQPMGYYGGDDHVCFGGIQEAVSERAVIFGDLLLKSQFLVFDQDGERVGWARQSVGGGDGGEGGVAEEDGLGFE
ncbi:Type I transmembrane sorting receptor [Onygenales sp. PD_10]|nr:Type I transmembrane sorting receptor [Onygenales sp. PD_10]